MRDKYAYVPGNVPAGQGLAMQRLAAVHGYVRDFFVAQKVDRKAAATTATTNLQHALNTPNTDLVQAFRTYEQAHLRIGNQSYDQLLVNLHAYVRDRYATAFNINVWGGQLQLRVVLSYGGQDSQRTISAVVREPPNGMPTAPHVLGRVYAGLSRFVVLPIQPPNLLNAIYTRQGFPNQHYIRYNNRGGWRYLRRYVFRGLNQADTLQIDNNGPLLAPEQGDTATGNEVWSQDHTGKHNVDVGDVLSDEQQILSHTRGWKKRFISTTTTFRPAYSTRGQEFRSAFGKVLIDLAMVPQDSIFDLHTPGHLPVFHTTGGTLHQQGHVENPGERDYHDEELLAGRDVIRTREVLIRGSIPHNAILHSAAALNVLGVWHTGNDDNGNATFGAIENILRAANCLWQAVDELSYRWNGNRWYKFYKFANPAALNNAWVAIPDQNGYWARCERYNEYDTPPQSPPGFDRI